MRVTVELQAHLDQYSPAGRAIFQQELSDGASVSELVRSLGIPEEMASVIIVNDASVWPEHVLRDGDHITLIPPLAGGAKGYPC